MITVGEGTAGARGLPAGMETTQWTDPKWSTGPFRTAAPDSNSDEGSPSATK